MTIRAECKEREDGTQNYSSKLLHHLSPFSQNFRFGSSWSGMFPLTHVIASKFGAYDSTIEGTTTSADGIAGIFKWVPDS